MNYMIDSIISGAIDMHVHSSPDVIPRKLSDIGVAKQAKQANLAGVMLKCHHGSTVARAKLTEESVPGIAVYGGMVLNKNVGGINPDAVETELAMGAKEVWMPTVSAVNHVQFMRQQLSKAVPITDEKGNLLPAVYEVLELVAKAGVILGTGHLSPEESHKLVVAAQAQGIKKILVTHPEWEVTAMPLAMQQDLAKRGVFFERCFYASNSQQNLPVEELVNQVKSVAPSSTILSSDFGQDFNEEPVVGFRRLIRVMLDNGIKPEEVEMMVKDNPRYLLNE